LLPGGAIQFPGGPFIPLWTSAFHGALQRPAYVSYKSTMTMAKNGHLLQPKRDLHVKSAPPQVGDFSLRG
jgi:hypothetical protein